MPPLPGFVGPTYLSQSSMLAGERCINFFPEASPVIAGKTRSALFPAPGVPTWASPNTGAGRGLFGERNRLFGVFGGVLHEFQADATVIARGAVAYDGLPVQITSNGDGGNQLLIAAGNKGYVFNLTTHVLSNPVDDVRMVGQIDGFFLGLDTETSTLKISDALAGLTWDAGQQTQRSAASDPWRAMVVVNREIFLFGETTGEVWYNAGLATFPFAYRAGSFFQTGIAAPWSASPFGDSLAWLGRSQAGSDQVFWMNGYTPNRISNHAVEWAISEYKRTRTITDAVGWSYQQAGHVFYVLEFPSLPATWVYDATTNQWHERARWDTVTGTWEAYRPRFHTEFFGRNLVCDGQAGRIYTLSTAEYADIDGGPLRRVRQAPHLSAENQWIIYDALEVEAERGVGLVSGQGSDPLLMMRMSRDGGRTWSPERTAPLGKMGEYDARTIWHQCGAGRDVVFEVSSSDPVPVRLGNAYLRVH